MLNARFHRLLVVDDKQRKGGNVLCRCLCDCGSEVLVLASNLRRGSTKSCGCWKKETAGRHAMKHGMSKSDEYWIWAGIKKRCYNPNHKEFHLWGGKGVRMSKEWENDFSAFYRDMGPRPTKAHSIDRIDSDGHYSAENCRWADDLQQSLNSSRTIKVLLNGETLSLRQFALRLGLSYWSVYYQHVRRGVPIEALIPGQDAALVPSSRSSSSNT